jgi:hypothetical protein
MKLRHIALFVVLLLSAKQSTKANTWDVGIGSSFAYNTVQGAINAASNGDTIIVHPGTYTGSVDFLSKNIVLTSTNPQNADIRCATILNPTIISTEIQGSGPYINASDGTIKGFTINGGITFGTFGNDNDDGPSYSPKVSNCNIRSSNWAIVGHVGYGQAAPTPVFENNVIESADGIYMFVQAYGEGMNPIIRNNTIIGSGGDTTGILLRTDWEMPTIENNIITNFGTGIFSCYSTNFDQRVSLIRSNDVYGNLTNYYRDEGHLNYNLTGINGNISNPPLFADGDYHLTANSPCIDVGMNAGCYLDMDGNLRPYYSGLNPNGFLPGFDIGAYELTPEPATLLLLGLGTLALRRKRRA